MGLHMSGSVTARDRVWATALNQYGTFKADSVHRSLKLDDRGEAPSRETVKRVLQAMTELGVLEHRRGSPYWKRTDR